MPSTVSVVFVLVVPAGLNTRHVTRSEGPGRLEFSSTVGQIIAAGGYAVVSELSDSMQFFL